MEIRYETLYNIAINKLQILEIENIKLNALCLEYQKKLDELNNNYETLKGIDSIE